jgi:hypothetical protein
MHRAKARARMRSIGAIDVGASAIARLAPSAWRGGIDQARCDLTLLDAFSAGATCSTAIARLAADPGAPRVDRSDRGTRRRGCCA